MKLTLDIINKIVDGCKDKGTFIKQPGGQDYWVLEIRFINENKDFGSYNIIHFIEDNDKKEYWLIDLEEDTQIECDYYRALESNNDYTLSDFFKEYEQDLETNKEVIDLVVRYEQCATI